MTLQRIIFYIVLVAGVLAAGLFAFLEMRGAA